jgi:diadenosine tetraphosphate (Ap4A) HIT family hydrolase
VELTERQVDPRIAQSATFITRLAICHLYLQRDGDVDWFVLVPDVPGAVNWHDLEDDTVPMLNADIKRVCQAIDAHCHPTKINVANLGNIVPQFHVHVIARYEQDRAWPGPIWGTKPQKDFDEGRASFWREKFKK